MTIKPKKAFTLVEAIMVVGIIGILSSIVYVSVNKARTRSQYKAVFTTIMSTQPIVYRCVRSGIANAKIRTATAGNAMCVDGTTFIQIPGFPEWPRLGDRTDWDYSDGFSFCNPTYSDSKVPTADMCGQPEDHFCGFDTTTGRFCYRLKKEDGGPFIVCTQDGCKWCENKTDNCTQSP